MPRVFTTIIIANKAFVFAAIRTPMVLLLSGNVAVVIAELQQTSSRYVVRTETRLIKVTPSWFLAYRES